MRKVNWLIFGESKGGRIYTISFACRRRTIIENVSQMGITTGAKDLRSDHSVTAVLFLPDIQIGDRLIIAWPACPGVEFSRSPEQIISTSYTLVYTRFLNGFENAGERSFGTLF